MNCKICSKPLSLIDRVAGRQEHTRCVAEQQIAEAKAAQEKERKAEEERRETQRRVEEKKLRDEEALDRLRTERMEKGIFKSLNTEAQMILDPSEQCCVLVKGCWSTLFYPRAAGRILPGQAVRVDGLKKADFGVLHITDKRICFVGKGGAKTIALKKILQCESHSDVIHVTAEGRASSTYFIIESTKGVQMVDMALRKLVALAKSGQKPTID